MTIGAGIVKRNQAAEGAKTEVNIQKNGSFTYLVLKMSMMSHPLSFA